MFSISESFKFLDSDLINWKLVLGLLSTGKYVFDTYLKYRQYMVLQQKSIPASIKAEIDPNDFQKSTDYNIAKLKLSVFTNTYYLFQRLFIIRTNIFNSLWQTTGLFMSRAIPFLPQFMKGTITHSLFFYTTISLISEVIDLPFSYYLDFVVEEKFGFNNQTFGLWLRDHIVAFALNTVIVNGVLSGLLKIFEIYGESFIIYATGFLVAVSLAVFSLSPFFGRLFNKYTPLQDEDLKRQIEKLASKLNFPKTNIFVIDGSTRSSHSNAYFIGLPWYKEIVIYDTLIEKQTSEGVVAVLAHELGHWKLNHVPKLMVIQILEFIQIFGLFGAFIDNKSLYSSFGFTENQPAIVGLVLFWIIKEPISTSTRFVTNIFSRTFEYQADEFAKNLGYQDDLSKSLLKLYTSGSSVTGTDWLYSAYYNSHPLLSERLSALGYISKEKISRETKSKPLKED
ncbi:hypothetical protein G9P44_002613 [Scheffersomyces stipitis]|nr:hypothetical protein G9P44_002613 [Scheffersomyces stipitis]